MAVSVVYMPILTFRDVNDVPLPFAKVYSYQAGTSTPLAMYATPDGSTPLANPAICDASGRLVAYMTLGVAYKLNVLDQNNVQVPGWPIDNLQASPFNAPSLLDDYSATVAQSELTRDPGEVGTEVLPTNMGQELEIIRFEIKEMKGTASHRTTIMLKEKQGTAVFSASAAGGWPPGATSDALFTFRLPYDYHSGNLAFHVFRRVSSQPGTATMNYTAYRVRDGQTLTTVDSGPINFAPTDLQSHDLLIGYSVTPVPLIPGDFLKIRIDRAVDAHPGTVLFDGHFWAYNGYASR